MKLRFFQANGGELAFNIIRRQNQFEVVNLSNAIVIGEAKEGQPFSFLNRGDNEPACTLVVRRDHQNALSLTVQNSSLHGMEWEPLAAAGQTIGLQPVPVKVEPLPTVDALAKTPTDPKKLIEIQKNQRGNFAPGVERPLDCNDQPGGLVRMRLAPGQKAYVIGDLHDNLQNLAAFLAKYGREIVNGDLVVIAGDAIHSEDLVIKIADIHELEKAIARLQQPSIKITDVIGNLLQNRQNSVYYLQGNHDQLYGKESERIIKGADLQVGGTENRFPIAQAAAYCDAVVAERTLVFAQDLNEFFFRAPLGFSIETDAKTFVVAHSPIINTFAYNTAKSFLEKRGIAPTVPNMIINARAIDQELFGSGEDRNMSINSVSSSLQWSRLTAHGGGNTVDELEATRQGFGPNAILIGGHTRNGSQNDDAAYLAAPGFVTLMSFYKDSFSVLEIDHTGRAVVVDITGQSPLGGQAV